MTLLTTKNMAVGNNQSLDRRSTSFERPLRTLEQYFRNTLCSYLSSEFAHYLSEKQGQGTTEYAILVGVLVVIAIVAIISFRDKVSQLWNAISEGINSL